MQSTLQNPTLRQFVTDINQKSVGRPQEDIENDLLNEWTAREFVEGELSFPQQVYINYCATGGINLSYGEKPRRLPRTELARTLGVHRDTLYDWEKRIPNFDGLVSQQRHRIFSQIGVSMVWAGVLLRAITGECRQAEMFLSNFDHNYISPSAKPCPNCSKKHAQGLAELVKLARSRKQSINQAA